MRLKVARDSVGTLGGRVRAASARTPTSDRGFDLMNAGPRSVAPDAQSYPQSGRLGIGRQHRDHEARAASGIALRARRGGNAPTRSQHLRHFADSVLDLIVCRPFPLGQRVSQQKKIHGVTTVNRVMPEVAPVGRLPHGRVVLPPLCCGFRPNCRWSDVCIAPLAGVHRAVDVVSVIGDDASLRACGGVRPALPRLGYRLATFRAGGLRRRRRRVGRRARHRNIHPGGLFDGITDGAAGVAAPPRQGRCVGALRRCSDIRPCHP